MNCPKCGAVLADGQKFCTNCGAQIPQLTVPTAPVAPGPQPIQTAPEIPTQVNAPQGSPAYIPAQPQQPQAQPMPYQAQPPQAQQPYQAPQAQQPYQAPQAQPPYPGQPTPPQPGFNGQPPRGPVNPPPYGYQPPQPPKKKSNVGLIIGIAAGAVALIAIILVLVLVVFREKEPERFSVDLNDYVTVEFEGYDSIGEVKSENFDQEKLMEDIGEQIQWTLAAKKEIKDTTKMYEPDEYFQKFVLTSLYGSLKEYYYDLSNGDSVEWEWHDVDAQADAKWLNVDLSYENKTFEVTGLKEPGSFDPFEGVTLECEGRSGDGYAKVNTPDGDTYDFFYYELSCNKDGTNWSLRNGDVVTVSIEVEDWMRRSLLEDFGKLPSVTSKEFTVEGLDFYLESGAQIPQELMDELVAHPKAQLENEFTEFASSRDYMDFLGMEPDGYFFTRLKEDGSGVDDNRLYLVYKISLRCGEGQLDYYWYALYTDFEMKDGEVHFYEEGNLDGYTLPTQRFEHTFNYGDQSSTLTLRGYRTLDELSAAVNEQSGEDYEAIPS